ncbi:VPA1262 family N-terminal domain-containing protein [Pantoea sp. PNT03]|jgi:hypothetical protein|uniref:VPA1262 family N-terminal domain-containing protein n=1 Tax=Pantoea sp. PNT03 TaxID=2769258 RepID=UPI0017872EC9|nr:VPA1262 family N-terminal domain-containing protein [Pantoea sp. PNT03]MBD9660965.1 hypothetical protein [Pantoea sp. PNT03]
MESTISSAPSSKWTDGFEHAVVHIAVVVPPKSTSEQLPLRLLFASVWLLASGRQAPSRPLKPYIKRFNKDGAIAVDRIVMTVDEAIQWYRTSSEELHTPLPLNGFRSASDGKPLSACRLSDFPSWPVLGVPMESEDIAQKSERSTIPFRNLGIIRYSRRISESQEWPSFLDTAGRSKQCEEALQFLEHHMHVDFREYPEYLGGMVLAVPDCDVHSVRQFVDPKEDGSESLYFHVKPHPSRKLQGLSLTVMEGQQGMLTSFDKIPVPEDGLVVIERPSPIHSSGLVLTHTERGVLLQTPIRTFLRQMNMRTEVIERRVKISAPETDKKKSPVTEYFSDKKTLASSQTFGDAPNTTDAFKRLLDAKNERLLNYSAKLYDQKWFTADQRKEALKHIRDKLKQANLSIFIADPYFSANQISQYLFAIERDDVKIQILTSSSAFKKIKVSEAGPESDNEAPLDTHQALLRNLATFQASHRNSIQIKVANTENSLFHDRFIAVDNRVWMIGSSLNSIGIRPTLAMRIPHGEKILTHLIDLYNNAVPLNDFKIPKGGLKKSCAHCGRAMVDEKEAQILQGAKTHGAQGTQDVDND